MKTLIDNTELANMHALYATAVDHARHYLPKDALESLYALGEALPRPQAYTPPTVTVRGLDGAHYEVTPTGRMYSGAPGEGAYDVASMDCVRIVRSEGHAVYVVKTCDGERNIPHGCILGCTGDLRAADALLGMPANQAATK